MSAEVNDDEAGEAERVWQGGGPGKVAGCSGELLCMTLAGATVVPRSGVILDDDVPQN